MVNLRVSMLFPYHGAIIDIVSVISHTQYWQQYRPKIEIGGE
jgi:heat shock protein HspQ